MVQKELPSNLSQKIACNDQQVLSREFVKDKIVPYQL